MDLFPVYIKSTLNDEEPPNNSRSGVLRQAKMHGQAGVRYHQGGHGVPLVPVARGGIGPRGIASGLPNPEPETVAYPDGTRPPQASLEGGNLPQLAPLVRFH